MSSEKRNKKILVLCPYPRDYVPAQRLKFEQYYNNWQENGYDLEISSFISERTQKILYKKGHLLEKALGTLGGYLRRFRDLFRLHQYDVVYIFLWATPFGPPLMERMIRRLAKKQVYDIDDLVYMVSTSQHNKFIKPFKSASKINYLIKKSDHVLVSTDELVAYSKKLNESLTVVPATIDVKSYNYPVEHESDTVVIGWSGSHTTSKYLHLIDGVLRHISQKYPVKIMVMGDDDFVLDGVDIELLHWTAETEISNIQKFDIGLHPLPDEQWVHGKSGGKLVQYMAAGLPIIATAIGPNYKVIKDGYNGFLVKDEQEWIEKLELLIKDSQLRKQMGYNSRKFAEENLSVEVYAPKYLEVFNRL
ncbi:MAG TPA: glycosyltransferase family 4 protein [Mucilaginibacter sp.]